MIPAWLAFCDEYPTPAACASASLGDVLRRWQGLGYPRRARNLHDAASVVVARHGGALPDSLDALLTLPGVGPYTARAGLAFAFERDVAVVDTNIARVLARAGGRRLTPKQVQAAADASRPGRRRLGSWNQMLMDLGARVCRPVPRCEGCPVAASVRVARRRSPRSRPGHRLGRREHPSGAVRRQRPPAPAATSCGPSPPAPPPPPTTRPRIVASLVADRLVVRDGDSRRLP